MKKEMQTFSVQVQGNSMLPLLQDKDIVEYVQAPYRNIKLNDIILVYEGSFFITHRVIYKTKNICITRGDNNPTADPIIKKGRVLAKVVRFKRKGVWYSIQDVYLAQSAIYLQEIQKLETLLQLQKLLHVFLKGVLISLRYEGAIPKRIYADCDILIQRSDYKKIEKTFAMLGYKFQEQSLLLSGKKNPENQPEISYMKRVNGIPVVFDVHFEPVFLMTQLGGMRFLYPPWMLAQLGEQIIKRGESKNIKGFNYSICSISDQILYLALHIFHHNYTDSIRYQLLDAVIRKNATRFARSFGSSPQDDWKKLASTIKEYRLEGYVYLVFIMLKKYFKTLIPQSFFTAIKPSSFKRKVSSYFLKRVDIFSQDNRTNTGIERFVLIFLLSPEPLWKKLLLFIQPEVIYTGVRISFSFFVSYIYRAMRHSSSSSN